MNTDTPAAPSQNEIDANEPQWQYQRYCKSERKWVNTEMVIKPDECETCVLNDDVANCVNCKHMEQALGRFAI